MTRILVAALALTAAGLLAAASEPAQPKSPVPTAQTPGQVDPQMPYFKVVAKGCDDCARACDMAAAQCAKFMAAGKAEYHDVLKLCQDCSVICSAAGRVVARYGPLLGPICTATAEACKQCADACEKYAADPILKNCAAECRRCEEACRKLLKGKDDEGKDDAGK
jgi:hypothetical protein